MWHSLERRAAWAQSPGASRVPSSLCPPHKGRVCRLCYSCLSLAIIGRRGCFSTRWLTVTCPHVYQREVPQEHG